MILREHKGIMVFAAFFSGTLLFLDFLTAITQIYVAPVLDGYGLSDIFVYLKLISSAILFVVSMVWLKNNEFKLTRTNFSKLILVGFILVIIYFLSLYIYKYILVFDTAKIIKDQILNGNPDLVFDLSADNYRTLNYVLTIYSGFNSEFIVFIEALLFLYLYMKTINMPIADEPVVIYDSFMYDGSIFPLSLILVIVSFTAVNLFVLQYDMLGSIEMFISLGAFLITIPILLSAISIHRSRQKYCTQTEFLHNHQLIKYLSIVSIGIFSALFILNLVYYFLDRSSYRIISSLLAIIISIILLLKSKNILSLENK